MRALHGGKVYRPEGPVNGLRLVRVDFDNLENHSPRSERVVATFRIGEHRTAFGKLEQYFKDMEPVKLYTGYDGQVYPQWRVENTEIL